MFTNLLVLKPRHKLNQAGIKWPTKLESNSFHNYQLKLYETAQQFQGFLNFTPKNSKNFAFYGELGFGSYLPPKNQEAKPKFFIKFLKASSKMSKKAKQKAPNQLANWS